MKMKEGLLLRGAKSGPLLRRLDSSQFSDEEKAYFQECQNEFLSDDIINTGLISINDFENRSMSLCDKFSSSSGCSIRGSSTVTDELQSIFFGAVCVSMPDSNKCVDDLKSLDSVELGYIISPRRMVQAQMQVDNMCVQMHYLIFGRKITSQNAASSFGGVPFTDSNWNLVDSNPGSFEGTLDLPASSLPNSVFITQSKASFSKGPIVGITVAAAACFLLFIYVSFRRYRRSALPMTRGKDDPTKNDVLKTKLRSFCASVKRGGASVPAKMGSVFNSLQASTWQKKSFQGFKDDTKEALVQQMEDALDKANWDEVYKVASKLAEHEDLSTLSGAQKEKQGHVSNEEKLKKRSNLTEDDFRRTRTLDDLIGSHDWTGVAVTAALFAGESGYQGGPSPSRGSFLGLFSGERVREVVTGFSVQDGPGLQALSSFSDDSKPDCTNREGGEHVLHPRPEEGVMTIPSFTNEDSPLIVLKESIDLAVEASDWDKVRSLSNAVEQHDAFQVRGIEVVKSSATARGLPYTNNENDSAVSGTGNALALLTDEMNHAINNADWSLVSFYAERMREAKKSDSEFNFDRDSRAIVPVVKPQAIQTVPTEDSSNSNLSRKATIAKLAQAGKWKGVSIMAGLYDMESKGSLPVAANTVDVVP